MLSVGDSDCKWLIERWPLLCDPITVFNSVHPTRDPNQYLHQDVSAHLANAKGGQGSLQQVPTALEEEMFLKTPSADRAFPVRLPEREEKSGWTTLFSSWPAGGALQERTQLPSSPVQVEVG